MKRVSAKGLVVFVVALSLAFAVTAFADEKLPVFKVGDTIYVCACGESCPCHNTISRSEGRCKCGKPLAKTTVTKVEGDRLFAKVDGVEQAFSTKAK